MTAVTLAQFIIGDGQVSLGSHIVKPNAKKVRQLKEGVVAGFAGATADAMTLFERLEMKLQEHPETLRACVLCRESTTPLSVASRITSRIA